MRCENKDEEAIISSKLTVTNSSRLFGQGSCIYVASFNYNLKVLYCKNVKTHYFSQKGV
jgi:hypothetical protein